MNPDGELYSLYCLAQQKWASEILAATRFDRSKTYRNILDVGCGTGEVTNILFDEFENGIEKLIAVDKYDEMVKVARRKNSRPGIDYSVADITDPSSFKSEWQHRFDLITSFLVLHWVPDQYQVLELVKTLLAPRGELLFVISLKPPAAFLKVTEVITKSEKWAPYLKGFVPSWRHRPGWEKHNAWRKPNPAGGYRQILRTCGFLVQYCEVRNLDFVFPDREYGKGMIQTILPHVQPIPKSQLPSFMDDVFDIFEQNCVKDEKGRCFWDVEFLVIHAQMPHSKDEL
ncbi:juvenile hormone acid O-methyltransferase-like [Tubulanus polymorphus]|uniref:juvenile hormone acid O-methyltransferase-like n=1 Tax=Tubulanus polymorphus TaxID=672921 RepID=UPI003DA2B54B